MNNETFKFFQIYLKSKFFLCLLFPIIVLSRIDEMRLEFRIPSTNCELATNKYTIHMYVYLPRTEAEKGMGMRTPTQMRIRTNEKDLRFEESTQMHK